MSSKSHSTTGAQKITPSRPIGNDASTWIYYVGDIDGGGMISISSRGWLDWVLFLT
jgi:hypothetical protein